MTEYSDGPGAPDAELEAVNEEMVALHERYHGRKPATARTMLMDEDMLAVLLGEIYTNIEKTMIELQRKAVVHETRSAFQRVNERRFIEVVERIMGRRVAQFFSTHHVGPDLELEIFLLEPRT
jgi:uncharacterized protein YbcI